MRLPSLDAYDVQGVRPEEAALWGGEVAALVDELTDVLPAGFTIDALVD
ncbi:hypothetical protein GCM10009548_02340 [Streptomyces malaysiensis subsp. malaysiensis]|uniref:Uncharacterized protein n=1 Tax=Streptomyces malaysiensis TaxID=92644 RepID=A0ABX6W4C1_STRMQ|nr:MULTISPECIES: hypothetical protein [Streptomyces]QPI56308.1 hypothetical protein I1A49_16395 [Streptomyces solisilvae]UHH17792.1 hypothetical protein LUV23_16515 [Streptomyces sp. HNM0561]